MPSLAASGYASPQDTHLHRMLQLRLHAGEAEAIALAADLNADMVLIDEQEGRELALEAGLSITGVLGILLKAKRSGHLLPSNRKSRRCVPRPGFLFRYRSKRLC
jgi:uncharacterized protein